MIATKLITLLKTLTAEEFKLLEKFTASPFFTSGRDLIPLLKIIKPHYPEFNKKEFTREYLAKKLFPGEKISDKTENKIRMLFSSLYKVCLEFLIQKEFQTDEGKRNHYLLNSLRIRQLDREFEKVYENTKKENELLKGSIADFINIYFYRSMYKNYRLGLNDYENVFKASQQMYEANIVGALIGCFKFESEKKLKEGYNIPSEYSIIDSLLENLDIDKLLEDLKQNESPHYIRLLIYYTGYKLEKNKDQLKYFYELMNLLSDHHHIFGRMEKYALWLNLESYCGFKLTHDNRHAFFLKEFFILQKKMLELDIYKTNNNEEFDIVRFRNMVITAYELKEYKWLKEFCDKYSGELRAEHKTNLVNFCHALLMFGGKNFEAALEFLSKIQFEHVIQKRDAKYILLKTYYELGYYEQVLSTIASSLNYLRNTNELPESIKLPFRNFMKFLKQIVKLKTGTGYKNADIDMLLKSVTDEKSRGQVWLTEKLLQLRTNYKLKPTS